MPKPFGTLTEKTMQTRPKRACLSAAFAGVYDGKDSPITGNNPDADMTARTRVNANTIKTISKKGGKVTTTQTSAVRATARRERSRPQARTLPVRP
jgi:hypothetical protein